MDAVSYSHADKQKQRIEKIIAQPDSTSGLVSLPRTIASGEAITIPSGRTVVHPNLIVSGTLDVQGTLFVPAGGSVTQSLVDATVVKQNGSVVANDSTVVHKTGNETKAGVLTLTDGLKLQDQNVTPFSGFKNYIINGNFNVWQRGTDFTGLLNGSYSADRWVVYDSVGDINYNVIRNAAVFTGGYGAQYTWNSGTGQRSIIQFIENITKFKVGKQVTISFEAYTTSTPYTIDVSIQGVKGIWASATSIGTTASIAITNTKTSYSVTLTVPDWTSLGIDWAHLEDTKLALKFDFDANTNGKNFIISNVQLEEGSIATPFENRPIGLELSLCQRYYMPFKYLGGAQSYASLIQFSFPLFRTMRVTPTLTSVASGAGSGAMYSTYGSSAATTYIAANSAIASQGGVVNISVSGNVDGGVAAVSISGTASAEL